MPGFDTGRFPIPPASEFVCQICYDILCDPVIVPECEHVFCSDCLTDWLSRSPTTPQRLPSAQSADENSNPPADLSKKSGHCPIDRTPVGIDELRPPQRVFRNLLSALLIRCRFAPAGCDLSVPICELDYHEPNCPHNPDNANREIDCPKSEFPPCLHVSFLFIPCLSPSFFPLSPSATSGIFLVLSFAFFHFRFRSPILVPFGFGFQLVLNCFQNVPKYSAERFLIHSFLLLHSLAGKNKRNKSSREKRTREQ